MNQFWMVYGIGTGAPTVRHHTKGSAIDEASRLARRLPGTTFVVLEAVKAVTKRDVDIVDLAGPDDRNFDHDGIPF